MKYLLLVLLFMPITAFAQGQECPVDPNYIHWSNGVNKCWYPGPRDKLKDGEQQLWVFTTNNGHSGVGYAFERCSSGKREVFASFCKRWCDVEVYISQGNCKYSYGKLGRAPRLNDGEFVDIGTGRCAAKLTCNGGDYAIVR